MHEKTIKVSTTTHKRLAALGNVLDSMDTVITRLLDFWDQHHKKGEL